MCQCLRFFHPCQLWDYPTSPLPFQDHLSSQRCFGSCRSRLGQLTSFEASGLRRWNTQQLMFVLKICGCWIPILIYFNNRAVTPCFAKTCYMVRLWPWVQNEFSTVGFFLPVRYLNQPGLDIIFTYQQRWFLILIDSSKEVWKKNFRQWTDGTTEVGRVREKKRRE